MLRGTQVDGAAGVPAIDRALAAVEDGLAQLVAAVEGGGLGSLDAVQLVGFLQRWERHRNRMPVVDHAALAEAEASRLPEALTQPNLARVLVWSLRVSAGEAHRRVRAAEALGPRTAMTGEPLQPRRPVLAAAQRAGEVTPEQVQVVVRALAEVDRPGFDPADVDAGEALLTGHAATFEPKVLTQLAEQVVAAIDPDGTLPDERLVADRRHLSMRPTRDGGYTGEFRLTGVAGAKLTAVLRPLAKPRVETIPDLGTTAGHDERSHGQRMHDALEDVCDRLLRSGQLPDSGGVPATVIVTIRQQDLMSGLGAGHTSDGARLSTRQVLELAEQADVIPAVLNDAGGILSYGRNRRLATPAQTWALIARDGGCSFPGCSHPPEWCERHHIVAWAEGGTTDLDNLTLLCRYHHHHFANRGWTAAINPDGLPEWTPPRWLDPHQQPLLNARIRQRQLGRASPLLPMALAGVMTSDQARGRSAPPLQHNAGEDSVRAAAAP